MRNKKLIPFEVIEKAVAGEPEAIELVLQHYSPRIKYRECETFSVNNVLEGLLW